MTKLREDSRLRNKIEEAASEYEAQQEAERKAQLRAARTGRVVHFFMRIVIIGMIVAAYMYRKDLARLLSASKDSALAAIESFNKSHSPEMKQTPQTAPVSESHSPKILKPALQTIDAATEKANKDAEIIKRLQTK